MISNSEFKNSNIPGIFQELSETQEYLLEDSRDDGFFEFWIRNHVLGQKLSGKSTLYVEIGKK